MGLFSYFQNLAAKAKKTTNSKEAKQIKDKLILIGAIMAAVGGIGAFLCFVAFGILGFNSVQNFGSFFWVLSPFFLFIPFAAVGGIGAFVLYLGIGIQIAKVATNFLDQNSYCPSCGDVVEPNERYCKKCGAPLLVSKICSNCNTENDMESKYCKNCGHML